MTTLLIVDTETTGLDPKQHQLIEVAGVLFDTAIGAVVECRSALVEADDNPAVHINQIPPMLLSKGWALPRNEAVQCIVELYELAKQVEPTDTHYIVAHNAAFDRKWLPELAEAPWLCTLKDVDWGRLPGGRGPLASLALAYGVGVVRAHRALEDCLTLAAIFERIYELEGGGLDRWITEAISPKVELIAKVSYDDRQLAKDAGFTWDGTRKVWCRDVRAVAVESFVARLPFDVRVPKAAQALLEGPANGGAL